MPRFSKYSETQLMTCEPEIRAVCRDAIQIYDFRVLQGYRTPEQHEEYLHRGTTTILYEKSKHSTNPSKAVDLAPWPIDWEDTGRFQHLAGIMLGIAHSKGIKMRWGGNWRTFIDMPHFELE